ncbi:MAG: alanine racemase [Anaerolineaceae bacterium]
MATLSFIKKPTLLLDEHIAKNNLDKLIQKLKKQQIIFRPHFKTHQSAEIGEWFRERGINQITVSSVEMAEYFAQSGWKDILIAFPVNILEIESIVRLSHSIKLSLLVESLETAQTLEKSLANSVGIWVKIDVGAGRTGILWNATDEIERLVRYINLTKNLNFLGLLAHSGDTYHAQGIQQIRNIYFEALDRLKSIKGSLESMQLGEIKISVGDTPSASTLEDFGEIDEFRPGNFLFYDVQQYMAGMCKMANIAVGVACPVVSIHKDRQEAVIYGGAIHFSKDSVKLDLETLAYGIVVPIMDNGWDANHSVGYLKSVSQEHGVIRFYENEIDNFHVGDIICILPAHSCLTVHAMRDYINLDGKIISTMNSKG